MLEALAIDEYSLPRLYEYIYHHSEERLCQAKRQPPPPPLDGRLIYPEVAPQQASLTIHRYKINTPGWREAL